MIKKCLSILMLTFLIFSISPCLADNNAKNAMLQMTTTLENSETQLQWNFAENIGDGRGITFGCIGFCTGTYDGNVLIHYYKTLNPDNSLAKYIPALDKIDAGSHNAAGGDGNPNVAGLDGFINDVHNCNDPLFKQAQLYELDQLYYNPAVSIANKIGAKNALTLAFIYDMCVRHGSDGAQSMVNKATSQCGGTPASGVSETVYLSKLISIRDSALKSEGLGDINRDAGFKNVLNSGNVDLTTPFIFVAYGDSFTITGDLDDVSSGTSVQKTIPTITWNIPADITYGTALSKTQLNASASVPGTLTYNPVAGTVLSTGTHTLHVDFTPTDTVKYNMASKDVTIKVIGKTTANLKAAFDATPTSGTTPLIVQLTDKSINANSLKWEFGDKSVTSSNSKTTHTYVNAGTYVVTLTAYKGADSDVATKTITVTKSASKINDIKADSIKGKTPMTVKFSCSVSGKPTSYTWIINKQTIKGDTRGKISYSFTKPGVYDVTLLVRDASGNTDKMTKKAFITVLPRVNHWL
jgi:chitosanase